MVSPLNCASKMHGLWQNHSGMSLQKPCALSAAQLQLPVLSSRTAALAAHALGRGRSKPSSMSELLRKQQEEQSNDLEDERVTPVPPVPPPAKAQAKRPASSSRPSSSTGYLQRLLQQEDTAQEEDAAGDMDSVTSPRPALQSSSPRQLYSDSSDGEVEVSSRQDGTMDENSVDDSSSPSGSTSFRLPSRPAKRLAREDKRDDPAAAVEYSLFLLGRRMMTHAEVRQKLADKGYTDAAAVKALRRLTELGEVDDVRYAKLYVRSKWRNSQRGPQLLKQEMQRKGIDQLVIKEALDDFFQTHLKPGYPRTSDISHDDKPPAAEESGLSSTFEFKFVDLDDDTNRDLLADLTSAAQARLNTMRNAPKEAQMRRLVGWLQRRGHSWDTISTVLKRLKLRS